MAEIVDSFTYSVARDTFRGYMTKGVAMSNGYFGEYTDPDEFVVLLSSGTNLYAVPIGRFSELNIDGSEASDVFDVNGKFSDTFEAAVVSPSRKQCDLCSMQTERVYKILCDGSEDVRSRIIDSADESTVWVSYGDDMLEYNLDTFYHCHHCMKDIHSEIQKYMEQSGQSIIVSHTV